jgi:FkbM family methyltransferase
MARLARSIRLWKRRTQFRPYSITKTVQGKSFSFCIGDETGELWYGPEKDPVYTELAFIQDHMLSHGDVVFDVGSHHGLHTICMSRHAARVVAIEPNPHNVSILKKNVALNRLQNVAVRQAAVGESCGRTILLQDSSQGGVLSRDTATLPTIEVGVLSLDRLADEYGFPQLLKIDVEGFEARALKGASQILQRRPKLAVEVHVDWVKRYGSTVSEVVGLLDLESYRVWIMPFNLGTVLPWKGEDFNTYPPPKFTLFLLPVPLSV